MVLFSQQNKALAEQVSGLKKELGEAKGKERDLLDKLRELQNLLMDKTKEYNAARDAQASLRAEIDTYRNLLDANKETDSR